MDKEEFRRRRAAIKAKSDKLWGDIEEQPSTLLCYPLQKSRNRNTRPHLNRQRTN